MPLFEEGGVQVAFENHNHTYKRTHRIKGGKVDESGVLYLGDGSWGVHTRKAAKVDSTWYLAKTASINSFYMVEMVKGDCVFEAIDSDGKMFDRVGVLSSASRPSMAR